MDLGRAESQAVKELEEWDLHEEIFWKQKAQIDWLQEGDKNTTFFHKEGYISSMVNSEGILLTSLPTLSHEASQYYSSLFSEDSPLAEDEENMILACIPSLVTNMMNKSLMRLISLSELEEVVFGMRKGKVIGPNGFPIEFLQDFWDIINLDLLEVVWESYGSKQILHALNSTFLVLIPKKEGANQLKFFRSIALCNVVYKTITKEWVRWMMSCVTSSSFFVIINGDSSELFGASRGLRQGDPLSPYLFILMVEGLCGLIKSWVSHGLLQGWRWGHGLPTLSHLQFVNDIALMGVAHLWEAESFRRTLDIYLAASRQKVNEHKSFI
ncbi:uncharacterized protein LOC131038443 [Cryptomeria japonica]|uniref:uncharacterized protein LOC131038443 n=1 Tax=Cryptomeria japonica TaxID=3369 RepID=UPI0027DA966B|nr:uncharacterized protein LOC131038443 [Cryptomeria japonica]